MDRTLGDRIKKTRKERGVTLRTLAEKVGSSKGYIWEIEKGRKPNPSVKIVKRIANWLDISVDWLVSGSERPKGKVIFQGWAARDKDGKAYIYSEKPKLNQTDSEFNGDFEISPVGNIMAKIYISLFASELMYENSPKRITITMEE